MGDATNGAFKVNIKGSDYFIICSDGEGWEHVSVSNHRYTPSWDDMCAVKDLFFSPEEVVMQLHPKRSEYVNNHPHCLHLWKPMGVEIPTPPNWMVGVK
jgi:hypothetical protein